MRKVFVLIPLVIAVVLAGCGGGGGTPTYTVTYDGNGNTGGSVPTDGNLYEQGQTVTVRGPGLLDKDGCTFTGWNTAANGSGTTYQPGNTFQMPAADVTLYARWALPIAYIYDSVDSPACASIESVLGDYAITRIPHNTVEITSASLNPYALIIQKTCEKASLGKAPVSRSGARPDSGRDALPRIAAHDLLHQFFPVEYL